MNEELRNPYAPPRSVSDSLSEPRFGDRQLIPGTVGICHDKGNLMIDRREHRFPDICLKSGVPTSNRYRLSEKFLDEGTRVAWFAGAGLLGAAIAWYFFSEKIELQVPVDPDKAIRTRRPLHVPIGIACVGILTLMVGGVGALINAGDWANITLLIGGLITFIGMIVLLDHAFNLSPPFKVVRTSKTHIWISGASEEYLKRLPGMMPAK